MSVILDENTSMTHDLSKGSLGAVVKLLPCDHEVMGSSPGNSLLQKCRERLRTIDPKWSDPSLDPAQAGATCTRLPFNAYCLNQTKKMLDKFNGFCVNDFCNSVYLTTLVALQVTRVKFRCQRGRKWIS